MPIHPTDRPGGNAPHADGLLDDSSSIVDASGDHDRHAHATIITRMDPYPLGYPVRRPMSATGARRDAAELRWERTLAKGMEWPGPQTEAMRRKGWK